MCSSAGAGVLIRILSKEQVVLLQHNTQTGIELYPLNAAKYFALNVL
ncbi:hypothetical protein M2451_002807 [Dysgonomonas sp. PFB1-18]|nr:hypothetical protein [Dysgonomonas sp. PF1-14]MDH6339828.1 hypothetical protein [Dysgonomonas sp. PF1-16]MDH6381476.1 hypothetical protein [Dysgonomonas sp. PFB1-18]MDH6398691.1 hypothetical protein [Dysgonomonas sp. PF1-23]